MTAPSRDLPETSETLDARLRRVCTALLQTFIEMDAEAAIPAMPGASGLQWYRGSRHKFSIKRRWLRELRRRLAAQGFPTRLNVVFKAGVGRCDCVVEFAPGAALWLEVVGVWKSFSCRIGQSKQYRCALFHPLLPNPVAGINTVPNALQRLRALQAPAHARTYAGVLVLGFETPEDPLEQDIEVLERISELRDECWKRESRTWVTNEKHPERVSAYFWVRAV